MKNAKIGLIKQSYATSVLLLLVLVISFLDGCNNPQQSPSPQAEITSTPSISPHISIQSPSGDAAYLLTTSLASKPVVSGHYVFWLSRYPQRAVYGYDLNKQEQFRVATVDAKYLFITMVANGSNVFWIDRQNENGQNTYHLNTYNVSLHPNNTGGTDSFVNIQSTDIKGPTLEAADDTTIYYHRSSGFYARNLSSGLEQPMPQATGIVAQDGYLLWSEELAIDQYAPPNYLLKLQKLNDSAEIVITKNQAKAFSGYSLDSGRVVWSLNFSAQSLSANQRGVWLYDATTRQSRVLTTEVATTPILAGSKAAWTVPSTSKTSSIVVYDIKNKMTKVAVKATNNDQLTPYAIINQNKLLYTLDNTSNNLYLLDLERSTAFHSSKAYNNGVESLR